jgi:hypothetical protein
MRIEPVPAPISRHLQPEPPELITPPRPPQRQSFLMAGARPPDGNLIQPGCRYVDFRRNRSSWHAIGRYCGRRWPYPRRLVRRFAGPWLGVRVRRHLHRGGHDSLVVTACDHPQIPPVGPAGIGGVVASLMAAVCLGVRASLPEALPIRTPSRASLQGRCTRGRRTSNSRTPTAPRLSCDRSGTGVPRRTVRPRPAARYNRDRECDDPAIVRREFGVVELPRVDRLPDLLLDPRPFLAGSIAGLQGPECLPATDATGSSWRLQDLRAAKAPFAAPWAT